MKRPKMITSTQYETLPLSICCKKIAESLPRIGDGPYYDETGLTYITDYLGSMACELENPEGEYGYPDARLWRCADGSLFVICEFSQEDGPAFFVATNDASNYSEKKWEW